MSVLDNLRNRLSIDQEGYNQSSLDDSLNKMSMRLQSRGGLDQWTRMREDKLRSLKKALYYSYQRAIVQKYNAVQDNYIKNIIAIITVLQDRGQLSESQISILENLEEEYPILLDYDRYSEEYINGLKEIVDFMVESEPQFRCLINHDKLKVDYEDKIISIPFEEPPVGSNIPLETNFHNGTIFKWIHGNKEEWTPDTFWIVYMQYSEQTAYFRGQIRKADQQIEIIIVNPQGQEQIITYRGWMTGPNETTVVWHTKKNISWNDLNYTKVLYITKDENTSAFFDRFDRVIINGKPWEVQAYNDNYSKGSASGEGGIIRVALKETYTNTDEFIKEILADTAQEDSQGQDQEEITEARIEGPTAAKPYSILTFVAKGFDNTEEWTLYGTSLAKIKSVSQDTKTVTIQILTGKSNKQGFYINYGDSEATKINVKIESF